jgi:NTP pyrophosphatase (non-canonical NTP hydrolase)
MMTIETLQKEVDHWITTIGVRYFDPLTNMAILSEEVGEVARMMSRMYGEQSFKVEISEAQQKQKLADEMADVIWVLTCLANQCEIDLTKAVQRNMVKKTKRDKNRHHSNEKLKS